MASVSALKAVRCQPVDTAQRDAPCGQRRAKKQPRQQTAHSAVRRRCGASPTVARTAWAGNVNSVEYAMPAVCAVQTKQSNRLYSYGSAVISIDPPRQLYGCASPHLAPAADFVAVAQTGTTAASSAVALSQSATSAAVNELERLLSLQLFDRTGKRLLLNDNGRALLPRAQALLQRGQRGRTHGARRRAATAVAAHWRQQHPGQPCAAAAGSLSGSQRRPGARLVIQRGHRQHGRYLRPCCQL